MLMSNAWLPGIIGPDTAPCKTRKAINEGRLQATPHNNEAAVKSMTDRTKVRTTPKRCINHPVRGTETPLATANDVITQVPWSELTPRLPAIVGIETLAIDVSSTCMKVPNASASAVIAFVLPLSAGAACPPEPLTAARPDLRRAAARHCRR